MSKSSQSNSIKDRPLGIFDSGVGGLSILREIRHQLPAEAVLYLADQANVPYGPQPLDVVRGYSLEITEYLLERGSKLIVVACNTASAASLQSLREAFPRIPFVGMEPAVKPAAELTRSKVVGVLATTATFQGELYASVVERFTEGVRVLPRTVPGLVEQVEAGDLDGEKTRSILEDAIAPLLAQGADTLVLACTHYPFVIPLIREITGPSILVIDPAPAIARQVTRLLEKHDLATLSDQEGLVTYYTSGDVEGFRRQLQAFRMSPGEAIPLHWSGEGLTGKTNT